jgi:hypothetical protein
MKISEQLAALRDVRIRALAKMDELVARSDKDPAIAADPEHQKEFNDARNEVERVDREMPALQQRALAEAARATPINAGDGVRGGGFAPGVSFRSQLESELASVDFVRQFAQAEVGRVRLNMSLFQQRAPTGILPMPAGVSVAPGQGVIASGYPSVVGRLWDSYPHQLAGGPTVLTNLLVFAPNTTGAAAAVVAQGALKPYSAVESLPQTLTLECVAHLIKVTNQLRKWASNAIGIIEQMADAALRDRCDSLAYAAITTAGRFTPWAPVAGSSIADNVAAVATALASAGVMQSRVAINPVDFQKYADQVAAGGAGTYMGTPPSVAPGTVLSSATIPVGKLLGFDNSGLGPLAYDGGTIDVAWGYGDGDWEKNMMTLRAEVETVTCTVDPRKVISGDNVGA